MIEECIARMFIAVYNKKFQEYAQETIIPYETRLASLIDDAKRREETVQRSLSDATYTINELATKRKETRAEVSLLLEEFKKGIKTHTKEATVYAVEEACKEALDKLGDIKAMMEDTIKELNDRYEEARKLNEATQRLPLTITSELMKYVAACEEAGIETTPEERLAFMDKLINAIYIDASRDVSMLEIERGVSSCKQLPNPTKSFPARQHPDEYYYR